MVPMTDQEKHELLGSLMTKKKDIERKMVQQDNERRNFIEALEATTMALRHQRECTYKSNDSWPEHGERPDLIYLANPKREGNFIPISFPTAEQIASVLIEIRELKKALDQVTADIEKAA